MAKRFIDTGLFDDSWFMNLSKDAKLLWLYLITKCDHAGIIDFNEKLCKTQTGIDKIDDAFKLLGNRCLTVREQYMFLPKFIYYQYPNFPNSAVRTQISAVNRLKEFNLIKQLDNGSLTLSEELANSYGNGNGNGNGNEQEEKGGVGEKTWRTTFAIYKKGVDDAIKSLMDDSEFIATQERLNPGVDVRLSIEKAYINYWGTEAGWKYKKGTKSKSLDWRQTFTNAITMPSNKVYHERKTNGFSGVNERKPLFDVI